LISVKGAQWERFRNGDAQHHQKKYKKLEKNMQIIQNKYCNNKKCMV